MTQATLDTLLSTHFSTRYGPQPDARAHLATWSPSAFVVLGEHARPLAETDAEALVAQWSAATEGPRFAFAGLEHVRPDGPDSAIAEFSLEETTSRQRVPARAGARQTPDGWRLEWVTLVEPAQTALDGERARLSALSELASLRAARALGPVGSLLEVSWYRLHALPKTRFLALPETAFSCLGTGSCCRHELTIGLDANAARFIEAIDWPSLAPHLGEGPLVEPMPEAAAGLVSFSHRLAREADGRCRFLTPDNRCSVHALAGRAVFKPCHVFPYRFSWSPDGICVTTNHMCPTARHGQGQPLATQEAELRRRLVAADLLRAEAFYFRPNEAVPWEVFKTIEGQLLSILEGEAPIKQKLWAAIRWLQARTASSQAGFDPAWLDESPQRLGLLGRMGVGSFPKRFDPCFKDLVGVAPGEGALPDHEAELTRFFRSLLFSKVTTYPYGLVAGMNYLALAYAVLERQLARHARKGISEAFWREWYAVVTSGMFFRWLTVLHQTPGTGFARVAGDAAFGLSLLRLED